MFLRNHEEVFRFGDDFLIKEFGSPKENIYCLKISNIFAQLIIVLNLTAENLKLKNVRMEQVKKIGKRKSNRKLKLR